MSSISLVGGCSIRIFFTVGANERKSVTKFAKVTIQPTTTHLNKNVAMSPSHMDVWVFYYKEGGTPMAASHDLVRASIRVQSLAGRM